MAAATALLLWATPVADDFCRATVEDPWPAFVARNYRDWSGRWLAMAFYASAFPRLGITTWTYNALLLLDWGCLLAGCLVAVRLLGGSSLGWRATGVMGLTLASLYLAGIPAPGETLYWLTGATEYTLPGALSIFAIGALVRAGREGPGSARRRLWSVTGIALVIAVTGLHEIAGLVLTVVLAGIVVALRAGGMVPGRAWYAALGAAVLGFMVTALAPGNQHRLAADFAHAPASPSLALVAETVRHQVRSYLGPWISEPRLLLATALLLLVRLPGPIPAWSLSAAGRMRWIVPCAGAAAVLSIFAVMALKVHAVGPPRLYNFAYGVFILAWAATVMAWRPRVAVAMTPALHDGLTALLAALLALGLLRAPNSSGYFRDLVGDDSALVYHRETTAQFGVLRNEARAGRQDVVLAANPVGTNSYFKSPPGGDPGHWVNQCVARYFGLRTLTVTSSP